MMAPMPYGVVGLRLLEHCRLRIKDVDLYRDMGNAFSRKKGK
jgi:hypothetical protein